MSSVKYTSLDEIQKIHDTLEASFLSGRMGDIPARKHQLARLAYMIKENVPAICDALRVDMNRPPTETVLNETSLVVGEAALAYSKVSTWSKDIIPSTLLTFKPMRPRIKPTPKGVVLIISPFNYPWLLTFVPLIGAIAAGNTVVLKVPETLEKTTPLMEELVRKYLDPNVVRVVVGSVQETTKLLQLKWDHILFTGSARVGHIVSAAAAKFNTPLTLELGGKCPVIVDPANANYKIIAKRILWGRTSNAGQTCTAPEYILIPRHAQSDLAKALKEVYATFFPEENALPHMVSGDATKRVAGYLERTQGEIVAGGKVDIADKFIAPTVLCGVGGDDVVMQDEIFGPLLSIVPVEDLDEAIAFINKRPQALAIYVFSHDDAFKERVTRSTRSGAIAFNDVVMQTGMRGLPFGGSGASGYGSYKGKYGFDTFTHFRSSMETPSWVEPFLSVRYPPYTKSKEASGLRLVDASLPFDNQGRATLLSKALHWIPHAILFMILGYILHRHLSTIEGARALLPF